MAQPSSNPSLKKPPGFRDPNSQIPQNQKPGIPISQIPPSFHSKPKRKNCFCCCFCFCCSLIFLIILLLFVFGALFYVWFDPKVPIFHIQSLQTPKLNVSVTSDGTFLDSITDVTFEATNPNSKIDFYYGQTEVRMGIKDDIDLGSATIPEFTQVRKNTTILKFETKVNHALIDDDAGMELKRNLRSKDFEVNVEVRTKVGVGLEKVKVGMMGIKVKCEKVNLKNVNSGDISKCSVTLFDLINLH